MSSADQPGPPIYTKTGDDGSTGLLFAGRVPKDDVRVEVCGTLDEAVAALGLARASLSDGELAATVLRLQRGLFAGRSTSRTSTGSLARRCAHARPPNLPPTITTRGRRGL